MFFDVLGRTGLKLDGWVELGPALLCLVFLVSCYDRIPCMSFFSSFFSDVLGCTWLKRGWVELGPTKIYVVIYASSNGKSSLHDFFFFLFMSNAHHGINSSTQKYQSTQSSVVLTSCDQDSGSPPF